MCKIIKYHFACHHGFRLRRSKCGGTKHKNTRGGTTPACKSDPYLGLALPIDCGPCQHEAFEDDWKRKLSIAELFLEKLTKERYPGVRAVAALVEQLKNDFNTATWDTRLRFPHTHKERAVRVSLGTFERTPSPLRHVVGPGDVSESVRFVGPKDPDFEFDVDFVASTDPLHPVNTNYAHPLDGVDPSWLLNHLSLEELEQGGGEVGFDVSEASVVWADCLKEATMMLSDWGEDTSDWKHEAAEPESTNMDSNEASQSPLHTAPAGSQFETHTEDEHPLAERIDMVIHAFWSLVNGTSPDEHLAQDTSSPLLCEISLAFGTLHFSVPSSGHTTPTTSQPTTTQAPSSTRRFNDNWRRHIAPAKKDDGDLFNRQLLFLSRCEIRDVEGASGRFVQDPQSPRDGDAKNGWFK